jgi:hypothetical protein
MATGYEGLSVYEAVSAALGVSLTASIWIVTLLSIWALVWKGLGLWKCGRRAQPIWFIILLITNTVGILPIIYLLIYRGQTQESLKKKQKKKK